MGTCWCLVAWYPCFVSKGTTDLFLGVASTLGIIRTGSGCSSPTPMLRPVLGQLCAHGLINQVSTCPEFKSCSERLWDENDRFLRVTTVTLTTWFPLMGPASCSAEVTWFLPIGKSAPRAIPWILCCPSGPPINWLSFRLVQAGFCFAEDERGRYLLPSWDRVSARCYCWRGGILVLSLSV